MPEFREFLINDVEDLGLLSALAIEASNDDGFVQDTGFRTMAGAGHQHFLGFARYLIEHVDPTELAGILFKPWAYKNKGYSLRWDTADYRPHALRDLDPSKDKLQSGWWANRLAFASMPMFPCYPASRGLKTAGFDLNRNETFTWPIWSEPVPVDVIRSLVPLVAAELGGSGKLRARGIQAVYSSTRFTDRNYRNFTAGRAVS